MRCRHYAFILNNQRILSIAENKPSRHPLQDLWGYRDLAGSHAEFLATIRLGEIDCRKLSLLTFRIDRNNEINNGVPCNVCQNFLEHFSFKEITYSNNNGEFCNK